MKTKEVNHDAYNAGKDAAINGTNTHNSHFSWFTTVESKDAWQKGYDDGKESLKVAQSTNI